MMNKARAMQDEAASRLRAANSDYDRMVRKAHQEIGAEQARTEREISEHRKRSARWAARLIELAQEMVAEAEKHQCEHDRLVIPPEIVDAVHSVVSSHNEEKGRIEMHEPEGRNCVPAPRSMYFHDEVLPRNSSVTQFAHDSDETRRVTVFILGCLLVEGDSVSLVDFTEATHDLLGLHRPHDVERQVLYAWETNGHLLEAPRLKYLADHITALRSGAFEPRAIEQEAENH